MSAPVLIGYDGSPGALSALHAVGELAPGRAVVIASAWTPAVLLSRHDPIAAYLDALTPPAHELDDIAREQAEQRAADGVSRATAIGLRAEPASARAGDGIAAALLAIARERGCSAIAIGRTRSGRVEELLLGSIPRQLLRSATIPVLVVPPADAD